MLNERDDFSRVPGNRDRFGYDAIHPGALCVRGANAWISDQHTPNLTPVNHRVKLRSFNDSRSAYPHRSR